MRAVIQRVTSASVTVENEIVSEIGHGLCVLLGINREDTHEADSDWIVRKILNLRMFPDPDSGKPWDKSVRDLNLDVLCVSQFTLDAVLKGNRLDFHRAMGPDSSEQFYKEFLDKMRKEYATASEPSRSRIHDGRFGAMMNVKIENDGPVTLTIDSKSKNTV